MLTDASKTQEAISRLRQLIGSLQPGTRIPSERDLAEQWGVARMTARKAVDTLVQEGMLDRRRGSGTYVTQMPYAKTLGLSSFTADMRRRGLTPASRVLDFERTPADPTTATRLGIAEGEEVVRFTRLRLADNEPIAVETTWMPSELVPGLVQDDLSGSLFETLHRRFGIALGQASSTIDPALADPEQSRALGLDPREPCLRIQMQYLDSRQRTVMAATCLYRGDRYQLQVVLTPAAFNADPNDGASG